MTDSSRVTDGKKATGETKSIDNTEGIRAYDDLRLQSGTVNFDNGGGGCSTDLDANTRHLLERYDVTNHVYDKFKRSEEHNNRVMELVSRGDFDTSTSNSVLNVIACPVQRSQHIQLSFDALRSGGVAYFKVWSGDGTGVETTSSNGTSSDSSNQSSYQSNRPAADYLDEVKKIFCVPTVRSVSIATRPDGRTVTESIVSDGRVELLSHLNLIRATK